jgi:hypothetical protein
MPNDIKLLKLIEETVSKTVSKVIQEEIDLRNDPVIKKYFDLIKGAKSDEELVSIINDIFEVAYKHGVDFATEMAKRHLV